MKGDACGCGKIVETSGTICDACKVKKYRKKNPMRYAYHTLRNNAKRRGKEFTISFEDFEKFCYETEYLKKRGKSALSFTIDRENDELGYVPGNLKCVTNRANVIKKKLDKELAQQGVYKVIKLDFEKPKTDNSDVPF